RTWLPRWRPPPPGPAPGRAAQRGRSDVRSARSTVPYSQGFQGLEVAPANLGLARRLAQHGASPDGGLGEDGGEPLPPDESGPDVGVTIAPRAPREGRVVRVDQDEAPRQPRAPQFLEARSEEHTSE